MKLETHSLIWPQSDMRLLEAHQRVTSHFALDVQYHVQKVEHGEWMDELMLSSKADVVGFIDIDCIPLDATVVSESAEWAEAQDSFVGIAQTSNRAASANHIYAGPAFLFISRSCYKRAKVSFLETSRSDVAEEFSYVAEARDIRFRCLFPTHFEREPREGVWPLASYGYFGIGTIYAERVYHLYQGRFKENRDLFLRRCEDVVNGGLEMNSMYEATDFAFPGRIAPIAKRQPMKWSVEELKSTLRNRVMRCKPMLR